MRILHLEDSSCDAELAKLLIQSEISKSEITRVTAGPAFEEAVHHGDFDIILSDYTIPGYSGLDALAFAKQHRPEKPFIYFSGTIGEERAIEALKCGAKDYIIKDRYGRLVPAINAALAQVEQDRARQQAEKEIRQQASLLDKAREAISAVDSRGCVIYWNASAEALYGWTGAEAVGRELRRLLCPIEALAFYGTFRTAVEKGEWRGERSLELRSGETILVESYWSRVTDESGQVESILIVEADITEQRRIERQLLHSQRLESLGLLTGGIAHDLNNVLAPILMSLEMLKASNLSDSDQELLACMDQSAQHGAELVQQLLAFSRGGCGKRSDLRMDTFMLNVQRLLRTAMPQNVELQLAPIPASLAVCADATQLRQVLLNLCINARDAMPEGGAIRISVAEVNIEAGTRSCQGEMGSGAYVRISVTDSGTGMRREILEKIFDPFFSTKSPGKGTGLGLVNVAEIVKSHSGFVCVESEVGAGTTFEVHLPVLRHS